MKDFFYAIQDLFVNVLFAPLDYLRELELTSWFGANIISWIFTIIGLVAFVYCIMVLSFCTDVLVSTVVLALSIGFSETVFMPLSCVPLLVFSSVCLVVVL